MKCNRTACQKEGATWWNPSTQAYYCTRCAKRINKYNPGLCRTSMQRVCFQSEATGYISKGEPIPLDLAGAILLDSQNRYPEIVFWLEDVIPSGSE